MAVEGPYMSAIGANVVGVILAGGLARRMGGGDKSMKTIGGRSMLDRVIERAQPQVGHLILNANGDPQRFSSYRLAVAPDVIDGFAGPLAGVLTGLDWAAENAPEAEWVASFAADAPFLPADFVGVLRATAEAAGAPLACAVSGGRTHPVFGLWQVGLRGDLRRAMVDEEIRKIDKWTARYGIVEVDFPIEAIDPFFNVNRPEDLAAAELALGALEGDTRDVRTDGLETVRGET